MNKSLKKFTLAALFLAMSMVGANIKLFGSIALDSFPGFVASVWLGPWYGMVIAGLGHFFSALLSGFPLTLPIHLLIAMMMGLCTGCFGWMEQKAQKNNWLHALAYVAAFFINVPVEMFVVYPFLKEAVLALFVPLTVASITNLVLTGVVLVTLTKQVKQKFVSR